MAERGHGLFADVGVTRAFTDRASVALASGAAGSATVAVGLGGAAATGAITALPDGLLGAVAGAGVGMFLGAVSGSIIGPLFTLLVFWLDRHAVLPWWSTGSANPPRTRAAKRQFGGNR